VRDSNVCFITLKLETALVLSGVFNLPGKKQLNYHNYAGKVIVIDANETLIERPKKASSAFIVVKGYIHSNFSRSVFLSDMLKNVPFHHRLNDRLTVSLATI
jgi:hypothetical protein